MPQKLCNKNKYLKTGRSLQAYYQYSALPLFVMTSSGNLLIWTADQPLSPIPGQRVVSLIPAATLAVVASDAVPNNA